MSYIIKNLMSVAKQQYVKLVIDSNEMEKDEYLEVHGWAQVCYHDGVGGSNLEFDDDSDRDKFHNKEAILPLVLNVDGTELEPVLSFSENKCFRIIYEVRGVVDHKP